MFVDGQAYDCHGFRGMGIGWDRGLFTCAYYEVLIEQTYSKCEKQKPYLS